MNKQKIKKDLIKKANVRILASSAISLFSIAVITLLLVIGYESVPSLRKNRVFFWFGNHGKEVLLLDALIFTVCLALILYRQYVRLASLTADLADSVSDIGKEGVYHELSPDLKDAEDAIRLANENIRQKELAAREAEQRKNDLVLYLAHDLKTPIASLIGYLTLLKHETTISPELHDRYVDTVLGNAERLDDLINEFFEITRFNLSSISLEYGTIDLSRLLQQMVFDFRPLLEEKGLTCVLNIPKRIELRCDGDKIERVFDNILKNAASYSFPETEIGICAEICADEVIVRFQNHGNTIPPDKLSRIFDQFFRLDASRSSKTGGSGLGLAIAKQIVTLHHGTITAESTNDTILFTVTLPLAL